MIQIQIQIQIHPSSAPRQPTGSRSERSGSCGSARRSPRSRRRRGSARDPRRLQEAKEEVQDPALAHDRPSRVPPARKTWRVLFDCQDASHKNDVENSQSGEGLCHRALNQPCFYSKIVLPHLISRKIPGQVNVLALPPTLDSTTPFFYANLFHKQLTHRDPFPTSPIHHMRALSTIHHRIPNLSHDLAIIRMLRAARPPMQRLANNARSYKTHLPQVHRALRHGRDTRSSST